MSKSSALQKQQAADAADEAAARSEAEDLCNRFLTNPVIEDAIVELEPAGVAS